MRICKNNTQDEIMLDFMKANPDMANRSYVATGARWDQLHKDLNLAGPPFKNLLGWKRVWQNRKFLVRQKLAMNPDGGLSANDETVAVACGMYQDEKRPKGLTNPPVKNEPLEENVYPSEDEKENRSGDMKELEEPKPKPKPKRRLLNPSRHISTDSQYISIASSESHSQQPMAEILKTLQVMTAQQANHFRSMEAIELQKLEVAKTISENIAKIINK